MKSSTTPEGGETQVSTTTHDKKMPPATGTQRRHQNSGTLKMPANGILLAAEPCEVLHWRLPPDGAYLPMALTSRWRLPRALGEQGPKVNAIEDAAARSTESAELAQVIVPWLRNRRLIRALVN